MTTGGKKIEVDPPDGEIRLTTILIERHEICKECSLFKPCNSAGGKDIGPLTLMKPMSTVHIKNRTHGSWLDNTNCSLLTPLKFQRFNSLITVHAGNEGGFIEVELLHFKSGDHHESMNATNYKKEMV